MRGEKLLNLEDAGGVLHASTTRGRSGPTAETWSALIVQQEALCCTLIRNGNVQTLASQGRLLFQCLTLTSRNLWNAGLASLAVLTASLALRKLSIYAEYVLANVSLENCKNKKRERGDGGM